MKTKCSILILTCCICCFTAFAQKLPVLLPSIQEVKLYSAWEAMQWQKAFEDLYSAEYDKLPASRKNLVDALEMGEGPSTGSVACSWYCGGGPYEITASSTLDSAGAITYGPDNAHDFNLLTAWVPDTKKGVTGAKIKFHFQAKSPRVNTITIYNEYMKNTALWKQNARVKKLKLYVDNIPIAILPLADVAAGQSFKIKPVQSVTEGQDMVLTLEILEVYKGTKYEDVAISEINFDGLDVHCLAAGTRISMADGTTKPIEQICGGDKVLSYDPGNGICTEAVVEKLEYAEHCNLQKLELDGLDITTTDDHPFWVPGKGWCSLNPDKSNRNYIQDEPVKLLSPRDRLLICSAEGSAHTRELKAVRSEGAARRLTYTLMLREGSSFVANGLVVKVEVEKIIE